MKRLYALRGATCAENTACDIEEKVAALYDELLRRNGILPRDIVSLIFSVTADLDARNPAAALRASGRAEKIALFAVQEARSCDAAGQLPRCIRVLLHYYKEESDENNTEHTPRPVYLSGAEVLRSDLTSPLADPPTTRPDDNRSFSRLP